MSVPADNDKRDCHFKAIFCAEEVIIKSFKLKYVRLLARSKFQMNDLFIFQGIS